MCLHNVSTQAFPNVRVINTYGPTEVTAVTVHHIFGKDDGQVVIGRPDANTHAYVVDARLRPAPVGVPGELLLSGPRLAIGAPAALTHSATLRLLPCPTLPCPALPCPAAFVRAPHPDTILPALRRRLRGPA